MKTRKTVLGFFVLILLLSAFAACTPPHYKLTVENADRYLYERPEKHYAEGDTVVIRTHIILDADLICFVNGKSIGTGKAIMTDGKYTHWEYTFTMPGEEVTVTFEVSGGM